MADIDLTAQLDRLSLLDYERRLSERKQSLHVHSGRNQVGLVYDARMMLHEDPEDDHPEQPARIKRIYDRLKSEGLTQRCVNIPAREATEEELLTVHDLSHVTSIREMNQSLSDEELIALAEKFDSIYFSRGTNLSALLAAGSLIDLSLAVAKRELNAGAAVIRPPGHHAEKHKAMGFCIFNNVPVAVQNILNQSDLLGINKILIVDWDVHHGNGVQHMFWESPNVLYFSIHRYDEGYFYPGQSGGMRCFGEGAGRGFNVNVPWPSEGFGDADYLAVFDHILLPIAREFNPDMVFISAGFDAALGDPLGGCCLTPFGYSQMTHKLRELAGGKMVLALEGGYNLESISAAYAACVSAMLGDMPLTDWPPSHSTRPRRDAVDVINRVRLVQQPYWPVLDPTPSPALPINVLWLPVENRVPQSQSEPPVDAKPSPQHQGLAPASEVPAVALGDSVWYACYGSNMNQDRFMCYVQGGQTAGMLASCRGCRDKTPPAETRWIQAGHRIWFGMSRTETWGDGGVCFLNPVPTPDDSCHLKLYKVSLQQFNDILVQENPFSKSANVAISKEQLASLVAEYTTSASSSNAKRPFKEIISDSWYGTAVLLGQLDGYPILTFTCSPSDAAKFFTGELPRTPPAEKYRQVIVGGLIDGLGLSVEDANKYIDKGIW